MCLRMLWVVVATTAMSIPGMTFVVIESTSLADYTVFVQLFGERHGLHQ